MTTHAAPSHVVAPLRRRQLSHRYDAKSGGPKLWIAIAGVTLTLAGIVLWFAL